jgi:hypothetical protein
VIPWRFIIFSTDGDSGVRNFKCVCSGSSCCVCGFYNKSTRLFFMIVFCVITCCTVWLLWLFVMFVALFCYHLCTWSVPSHISEQAECWCCTQWLTIAQSKEFTRLVASLPEEGSRASFWIVVFFKISYDWQSPKKEDCVSEKIMYRTIKFN